jgi:hypothetical protein
MSIELALFLHIASVSIFGTRTIRRVHSWRV